MDALRRLSWSQFRPISHPQTSQSSQTTTPSTLSRSSSVKDLVHQIESNQEHLHRASLEKARPQSPMGSSLGPHPASSHLRAMSPAPEAKNPEQIVPRKVVKFEGDSMLGSYLQLPALPKGLGGDFGREFVGGFVQSRLAQAVDSAADDSDELLSIPDTPTGYARFGFISRESFNTAVQDLVQQSPDTPIGGEIAAPMKRPSNVGTLAINGSRVYLDGPQFDVSSPPNILDLDSGMDQALRARSNFTDSFQEPNELKARASTGPSSPTMITAPQSPKVGGRNEMTSFSVDGPGGGGTDIRDFAQQPAQMDGSPPLPDCCVSPRSVVSDICIYNDMDTSGAKENLREAPLGPVPEFSLDKSYARETASMSGVPVSKGAIGARAANAQGVTVIVEDVGSKGPNGPSLPQALNTMGEVEFQESVPPLDLPQAPALGLPMDGTGQLLPPGTPLAKKDPKRKKVIRRGQKVIRKGRGFILKKPVLAVVVGRQLSGPTADALKLISKGVPVDASDLAGAVRPPAPVPEVPA
jgi:hypothetical protein